MTSQVNGLRGRLTELAAVLRIGFAQNAGDISVDEARLQIMSVGRHDAGSIESDPVTDDQLVA